MGLGSGIQYLGFGFRKNLFPIPDPGFKKAPDPGSAPLANIHVGSRFWITNISANTKSKSKRLRSLCKGPMPYRLMQTKSKKPVNSHFPLISPCR